VSPGVLLRPGAGRSRRRHLVGTPPLAIEGDALDPEGLQRLGDQRHPVRPIMTAPREHTHPIPVTAADEPEAVVLDLIGPDRAGWHELAIGRKARLVSREDGGRDCTQFIRPRHGGFWGMAMAENRGQAPCTIAGQFAIRNNIAEPLRKARRSTVSSA
jgi:hypothetical protein